MPQTEATLKQAAVEFLEAAEAAARAAAADRDDDRAPPPDPLDDVSTAVLELGDLEPAIGPEDLAALRRRLRTETLLPATVVELVGLARQVAAVLLAP